MKPAEKLKAWRENPLQFVHENFKIEPDEWQKEALLKLGGPLISRRRLAMKSCTGAGKSAILAWAGWHRLCCFGEKGEHPKGAALSGGGRDQLRDNLFSEVLKWGERSDFIKETFNRSTERVTAKGFEETWFLSARSYAKDSDSEAIGRSMSGLHSKFPFILLDEIGDMPISVGQKAEQIFTGVVIDGLIGGAGNPTSTDGLLYQLATHLKHLWEIITVTADPDDPKRTPRVDIEHARQQIEAYGRENPWVMSTILGLFPSASFNTLLSPDEVEMAMGKHLNPDQYDFAQKRIGIDVARFGDDRTVIFPRQGLAAFKPVEMRNARTQDIAARVAAAKIKFESEIEFVDGTGGYGAGVIDFLLQAGHSPLEIHFSGKSIDPRYLNKRAEMWFSMAEWIKRGGALPNIPELSRELTAPTYTFQNGKFQIEPKDQIKDRLGFSPDLADALALTFALPEMPRQQFYPGHQKSNKVLTEFDPFDVRQL